MYHDMILGAWFSVCKLMAVFVKTTTEVWLSLGFFFDTSGGQGIFVRVAHLD